MKVPLNSKKPKYMILMGLYIFFVKTQTPSESCNVTNQNINLFLQEKKEIVLNLLILKFPLLYHTEFVSAN